MKNKKWILSIVLCLLPIAAYLALYDQLPDMIPSHFIQIDKIPLNNNGKTDRLQLLKLFNEKKNLILKNLNIKKLN